MNKEPLILMKKNEEPIADIGVYEGYSLETSLTGVSELRFSITNKVQTKSGDIVPNYTFNLLDGDMIVQHKGVNYITNTPIETTEGDVAIKEVVAYSAEYELRERILLDFKGDNRVIYDVANQKDDEGVHFGLLNYIVERTDWTVGYYNTDVLRRTQTLSYEKVNMLQAITECQKLFNVILQFNTQDKIIDIYDVYQIGEDRGLYLSNENFIQSLKKTVNDEKIVTRLYCYGREDIDISRVNITGQPYVEDYSYYMTTDYMTERLINELRANRESINEHKPEHDRLFGEILKLEKEQTNQEGGIRLQQGQLESIQRDYDAAIADDEKREKFAKEIEKKEILIKTMTNKLDDIKADINAIQKEIDLLAEKVEVGNNLSPESKKELNRFIKESVYNNTSYWKYNLDGLYKEGLNIIQRVSRPQVKFEIPLDEFNEYIDYKLESKINLGDIVHIENMLLDEYMDVRLIGIIDNGKTKTLKFSSKDSVYDEEIYMEDLLAEAAQTSKTVDFSKFNWDKAQRVDNDFRDYINAELNLSNQGLVKTTGQKPVLDDRGLWLYKEDDKGNPLPEQIRAVNNLIAITKDNWKTVEVAITPEGVMANQLVGDIILGTDLKILSNSGVVEILENLLTIRDDEGRVRVQLGKYDSDKYGLLLKDKSGNRTILDEDGMLQVWQEGSTDNVDSSHGLDIRIFIPKNVRSLYDVRLSWDVLEFRSYSGSTDSDGYVSKSTEDKARIYTTAKTDGAISTTTQDGGFKLQTSHSPSNVKQEWVRTQEENGHSHKFMKTIHHEHKVEIPNHVHKIDISGHTHQVEIEPHSHEFTVPSHSHRIYPIIQKSGYVADNVRIKINGTYRTREITGKDSISGKQDNLDITKYLTKGKMNTITLIPDNKGRIDATVFVQALMNFNKED